MAARQRDNCTGWTGCSAIIDECPEWGIPSKD